MWIESTQPDSDTVLLFSLAVSVQLGFCSRLEVRRAKLHLVDLALALRKLSLRGMLDLRLEASGFRRLEQQPQVS